MNMMPTTRVMILALSTALVLILSLIVPVMLAKIAAVGITAVVSFLGMRHFIFTHRE